MRISTAYFEITNQCNLNCTSCYNRSGLNHERVELTLEHMITIMDKLASCFETRSFAFAGGEPFLHTEIQSLLSYISKAVQTHPDYNFSFVTNGTVHNSAFIQLMQDYPQQIHLQISLDGSCEAVNSLTRGPNAFGRAIHLLSQVTTSENRPVVKMVISQNNLTDVEAFYRMVVSAGGRPDFAFINRSGNAEDNWEYKKVSPQEKVRVIQLIEQLNTKFQLEKPAALPRSTNICPLTDTAQPASILIKSDGMLQPCQLLYDSTYSFGNILHDSPEQLEQGMTRLSQQIKQRLHTDYGCYRCLLRENCGKGCPALAVYNHQNLLAEDDDCLTRRLEFLTLELRRHVSNV